MAQAAGEGDVVGAEGADALAVHVGRGHLGAEDDAGHDGGLGGGVVALHVGPRVGLGVAQGLRLGQGVDVGGPAGGHAAEDVVGGAVDDAHDAPHRLAGQGLPQCPDDGDGTAHRRLEQQVHAAGAGRGRQFGTVRGDDLLVGGDDRLAGRHCRQQELPRRFMTADELHHHVDVGIRHDGGRVAGEQVRRHARSGALGAADRHGDRSEFHAAARRDVGPALRQQPHERRSDRAAAQDADADPRHAGRGAGRRRGRGNHPAHATGAAARHPAPRPEISTASRGGAPPPGRETGESPPGSPQPLFRRVRSTARRGHRTV